ncbi:anti-repressor protein [Virgibacillus subterraneus]|uniref:Anti-repressor protein n=1 Tax=Virgibacillus subterraneus TaxID=621109 RepID=A0A1H9EAA4_9BACI|nr:phage antirepressor KilAC domain-containing protein [Virgibacillus subterraneus]SEQ22621.1 anti-repressor protein [Virgibacillus subterraneus]
MNQLTKMFDGFKLRMIQESEQPLFLLNDACEILNVNPRVVKQRLDKDVCSTYPLETVGGTQDATFVNEDGLYDVILDSRKSEAKRFRKWITSEVLPSIRKTGGYVADDDMFINTYLPQADEQTKSMFRTTLKTMKAQNEQLATMKPKALFADAVETSKSSVLIGELSKILRQNGIDIGQNRLFGWLRDNGYLIRKRSESYNLPTQKSMDMGLFEIKKRSINNPDGSIRTTRTTKVTGKGQIYFVNKFLEGAAVQ